MGWKILHLPSTPTFGYHRIVTRATRRAAADHIIAFLVFQFFQNAELSSCPRFIHGRMARGGHKLPKVLSGLARPYSFTLCMRTTTVGPNSRLGDGPPSGWAACSCLLHLWTPHAVRLWFYSPLRTLVWFNRRLSIVFILSRKTNILRKVVVNSLLLNIVGKNLLP
jgi:hypothetical protein